MSGLEIIGHRIDGRKTAAGAVAAGIVLLGMGSSSQRAGAAPHQANAPRVCANDPKENVHNQFNLVNPDANYCLKEALPMGRTNIFNNGDYGELGLVAIKMTFEGRPYACIVPVTGHNNVTTLTPEAFSLKEDCLPDPGDK